jgi:enhancing lycopene biosynthesis protein 2
MAYAGQTGGRALNRFLANQGLIQTLDSNNATIGTLNTGTISTANATITDATIVDLSAVDLNVTNEIVGETIVSTNATFTNLTTTGGVITDGTIATLTTTSGFLTNADITNLDAINTTMTNIVTSDLIVNGDIYFSGSISGNLQASVDANVDAAINANTSLIQDVSDRLFNTQERDDIDIDDISDRVLVNEGDIADISQRLFDSQDKDDSDILDISNRVLVNEGDISNLQGFTTDISNQYLRLDGGTMTGNITATTVGVSNTLAVGRTDISNAFNSFEVDGNARIYGELRVDGSLNIGPATVTFYDDGNGVLRMQHSSGTGMIFDLGEGQQPTIKPLKTTNIDAKVLIDNTAEGETNPQLDLGTDGAVGIGITDPSGSLHVSGDTYITSGKLMIGSNTEPTYDADIQGTIRAINSAYLATDSGDVGIGTTTPAYKLDVSGDSRITGDMIVDNGETSTITVYGNDGTTDNKNNIIIKAGASNAEDGTMENYIEHQWYPDSAETPNYYRAGIQRGGGEFINRYAIESENGEHLSILSNGNVGFTRLDPTHTVDINGTLRASGATTLETTLGVAGTASITNTTDSTSSTTGALVVSGGVGVAKKLFVGGSGHFTDDVFVASGKSLYVGGPTDDTSGVRLHYSGNNGYIDYNGNENLNFRTGDGPSTRMVITVSGDVGIGTTNPLYKLDVNGTLRATGITDIIEEKESTAYDNGALVVYGGVGIAKNLNVNGNVGIGVATTATPEYKLEVSGNVLIAKTGTTQHTDLQINAGNSGGNYTDNKASLTLTTRGPVFANENYPDIRHILDPHANTESFYRIEGGHTYEGSAQTITITRFGHTNDPNTTVDPGYYIVDEVPHKISDTTQSSSSTTGALVVSGGVGIAKKLFVDGSGHFTDDVFVASGKSLYVGGPTDNTNGVRLHYSGNNGYIDYNGGENLNFRTGDGPSTRMVITVSGDVGIGTTTPAYKLDVNGTLRASGATTLESTLDVADNTSIGTGNDTGIFKVNGNEYSSITLKTFNDASNPSTNSLSYVRYGWYDKYFQMGHHRGNAFSLDRFSFKYGTSSGYGILDSSSQTEILTLKPSGNVGIGTTTPAYKLDVNGDSRITGDMIVDNGETSTITVYGNDGTTDNKNNIIIKAGASNGVDGTMENYIEHQWYPGSSANPNYYRAGIQRGGEEFINRYAIESENGEHLSILSNGNVGFTRLDPTYTVDINGTLRASGATTLETTLGVAGTASITNTTTSTSSSSGALVVSGGVGVNENLNIGGRMTVNGNLIDNTLIGLKTTDSIGRIFNFLNSDNSKRYGMRFTSVSGDLIINNDSITTNNSNYDGKLYLQSQNDVLLGKLAEVVVKNDGKVGIGTTNPLYKLDVSGTLRATGITDIIEDKESTAPDQGALVVSGGVGIAKNLNVNGSVGIGTTTSAYKLDVNGTTKLNGSLSIFNGVNSAFDIFGDSGPLSVIKQYNDLVLRRSNGQTTQMYIKNENGNVYLSPAGNDLTSYASTKLFVGGSIHATGSITGNSDYRIKNNIIDISDDSALTTFRKIQPKIYEYIDKEERGHHKVYGFIAQEVGEILPNAIRKVKNIVPDYYRTVDFDVSYTTDLSGRITNSTLTIEHDISYTIDIGNNVKLYIQTTNGSEVSLTELATRIDDTHFSIQSDQIKDVSSVFLYGKEVDDFHTLNKDPIWTVTTAALQEVDRNVEKLRKKNHTVRGKVSLLSSAGSSTGVVILPLDDTEFTNPQVFLQNNEGWSQVKGTITGNTLTVVAKDADCTDTIDYMVTVDLVE